MEEAAESRPKRLKRESSYKAKAFEKFKQLKSGVRNKYEEEEVDNIYETVDEKEYVKKVLSRQDDDWIVDDDGSGYVEDGRDIFDDDLDLESIAAASSSRGKGVKRKKKAVSENAGRGNLQYMLSNMPAKKKEEEKLDNDQILSELLGEIDEDQTPSSTPLKPKPVSVNLSVLSAKKAEKDYIRALAQSRTPRPAKEDPPNVLKEIQNEAPAEKQATRPGPDLSKVPEPNPPMPEPIGDPSESRDPGETAVAFQDCFEDNLDMVQFDEFQSQPDETVQEPALADDLRSFEDELMADWGGGAAEGPPDPVVVVDGSEIPLTEVDGEMVFRFFWWDAFENAAVQPGVVFLFGKTYHEESKSYISCCVAVRDIERKLFFLPRQLAQDTRKEVTSQDVYNEVNEKIIKPRQVKDFKSRPVTKKYAFDPEIPAESDYVEVRYAAKYPGVPASTEGKTFSRVFGADSSYLEILLLERKIKGPCWLDVFNPVTVTNPITWCKLEVNCHKTGDVHLTQTEKPLPPPPLVVSAVNMRRAVNPKTGNSEIVMLSCVTNNGYAVDKQCPSVPFQKHFCVFTCPEKQVPPMNLHAAVNRYKTTTVQKMDSEKALLNFFINNFAKLDCDLVVGHDLQGHQINVLSERLVHHQNATFSRLGRVKRTVIVKQKLEKDLFVGRLVCDVKISAKELIKCRSYDLDSLCQAVLKLKDGARIDLGPEDVPKMFQTVEDVLKLVSLTMQDTTYVLRIMYGLNIMPLALQITNIAGNVMSKTLMGGRSERNEFLLLHAFWEKDYIVPDKVRKSFDGQDKKPSRKKPAYSGGLVLDPKVGFYDKLVLLMDFNSLYPSIIQEYNICFTTTPPTLSEDNMVLPDRSLPPGILPTEIRKLVESRREVKKLMNAADVSGDLKVQYHIRQMALKLTANSMYGCLGFSNSRFYAKNLAALVTHKGREILTSTKEIVQKMNFEVIYGDTDSLMINTNITDYNKVFKIGSKIKQEINRLYKQVELDIDGVFKYLLLLRKKKYAAVSVTKGRDGELRTEVEYKGLDIVRRDWSQLSAEAGKFVLNQILSDQPPDDRINNVHAHLGKLKEDLEEDRVPLSLLVITKQLTKNPTLYADKNSQPHVQVALRYNKDFGGHYRAGDTVSYIICVDGTANPATQRAYHVEEVKNSQTLKIDVKYYLSQQIHPVVSRICEPIEGTDSYQIAECLGLDLASFKKPKRASDAVAENITRPEIKFRDAEKFRFDCLACRTENCVGGVLEGGAPFLERCANGECAVRPIEYLDYIRNRLIRAMRSYVDKYYAYDMMCEDPMCTNETRMMPMNFSGRFPVCTLCHDAVMLKKYTESNLYAQLTYFQYIFEPGALGKKPTMEYQVEMGYQVLRETVESRLKFCAYSIVSLTEMFSGFVLQGKGTTAQEEPTISYSFNKEEEDE